MYAIITSGNKQYKVQEGDVITVEKLGADAGSAYSFDQVLAIGNNDDFNIGTPFVKGAKVAATVLGDGKAKKVIVYKFKAKKGYHKKKGHRQPFTKLKIDKITAG
jgi:large subunit ribosomal protein L21